MPHEHGGWDISQSARILHPVCHHRKRLLQPHLYDFYVTSFAS